MEAIADLYDPTDLETRGLGYWELRITGAYTEYTFTGRGGISGIYHYKRVGSFWYRGTQYADLGEAVTAVLDRQQQGRI